MGFLVVNLGRTMFGPALKNGQICRLDERHLDAVVRLEQLVFSLPWSREQLASLLQQALASPFYCYGIMQDGELIAYLSFYQVIDEIEILNIAVDPAFRCQGYASMLMAAMFEHAGESGVRSVYLEVRESNIAAIGLYTKFSFQGVGRRLGYYPDSGEDALVMRAYNFKEE